MAYPGRRQMSLKIFLAVVKFKETMTGFSRLAVGGNFEKVRTFYLYSLERGTTE